MKNNWNEMSYRQLPIMSNHDRMVYEFESEIDVEDFNINEYLDIEEE